MKCEACKYEYTSGQWNPDIMTTNPIDHSQEEFKRIQGNFTVKSDYTLYEVSLFACPKCSTVKMSL